MTALQRKVVLQTAHKGKLVVALGEIIITL